jgi:SAM-dependent methyltransferase
VKQTATFAAFEADAWFARNKDRLGQYDPVSEAIKDAGIAPRHVLEIGCANGWRLKRLQEAYGCRVAGAELSRHAETFIHTVSADELSKWWAPHTFDMVIFGFCLYVCDREDLFKIAYEADLVLKEHGWLILHDFLSDSPHSVVYKHNPHLRSYKQNYAEMFLWHPAYKRVSRIIESIELNDRVTVDILRKDSLRAYPLRGKA